MFVRNKSNTDGGRADVPKRYLASTDEVIGKLSARASRYGYAAALEILVRIRNSNLEKL